MGKTPIASIKLLCIYGKNFVFINYTTRHVLLDNYPASALNKKIVIFIIYVLIYFLYNISN